MKAFPRTVANMGSGTYIGTYKIHLEQLFADMTNIAVSSVWTGIEIRHRSLWQALRQFVSNVALTLIMHG